MLIIFAATQSALWTLQVYFSIPTIVPQVGQGHANDKPSPCQRQTKHAVLADQMQVSNLHRAAPTQIIRGEFVVIHNL